MNKQAHLMSWDMMRLRHGILLRVVDQIPEKQLTASPIPGMRTPVELLVHLYASSEQIAASVLKGKLEPYDEKNVAAAIKTRAQLRAFLDQCWASADQSAHAVTDAQLAGTVETPWGKSFPGFAMFGFIGDEFLHHRGQLYAYVRTYGIEPVMVWDFEHNAPEFQPQVHARG